LKGLTFSYIPIRPYFLLDHQLLQSPGTDKNPWALSTIDLLYCRIGANEGFFKLNNHISDLSMNHNEPFITKVDFLMNQLKGEL